MAAEKTVDVVALDLLARCADELDPSFKNREAAAEKVFDDLVALDGHFGFTVQRRPDRLSSARRNIVEVVLHVGSASTGVIIRGPSRESNTFRVVNSEVGGDPTEVTLDYDPVATQFRTREVVPAYLLEPGAPAQYRSAAAEIVAAVVDVLRP